MCVQNVLISVFRKGCIIHHSSDHSLWSNPQIHPTYQVAVRMSLAAYIIYACMCSSYIVILTRDIRMFCLWHQMNEALCHGWLWHLNNYTYVYTVTTFWQYVNTLHLNLTDTSWSIGYLQELNFLFEYFARLLWSSYYNIPLWWQVSNIAGSGANEAVYLFLENVSPKNVMHTYLHPLNRRKLAPRISYSVQFTRVLTEYVITCRGRMVKA